MTAYATLEQADAYFETRLFGQAWANAAPQNRSAALTMATEQIDRLNFNGMKHAAWLVAETTCDDVIITAAAATQELQFPRGRDTVVPVDIRKACYEIAILLLDGKDADEEFEDLPVVSQGYSSVRRTYSRNTVQEHLLNGIVSPLAWRYLRPFLRDALSLRVV
jgi:hypothetical protein